MVKKKATKKKATTKKATTKKATTKRKPTEVAARAQLRKAFVLGAGNKALDPVALEYALNKFTVPIQVILSETVQPWRKGMASAITCAKLAGKTAAQLSGQRATVSREAFKNACEWVRQTQGNNQAGPLC